MTTLPDWLEPGHAVVYFPRRNDEYAEAWVVTDVKVTASGQTAIVKTEAGDEFRFRLPELRIMGHPLTGKHSLRLLPADDATAEAAERRTKVMRAVERLNEAIRKRPTRTMSNEDITAAIAEIRDAATVAHDDLMRLA